MVLPQEPQSFPFTQQHKAHSGDGRSSGWSCTPTSSSVPRYCQGEPWKYRIQHLLRGQLISNSPSVAQHYYRNNGAALCPFLSPFTSVQFCFYHFRWNLVLSLVPQTSVPRERQELASLHHYSSARAWSEPVPAHFSSLSFADQLQTQIQHADGVDNRGV